MSESVEPGMWSPVRTTVRALFTVPTFMAAHAWRSRHVERRHDVVDELSESPPEHRDHPRLQSRDAGIGPLMQRTYCVDIVDPVIDRTELMHEFRTDPNHFTSGLIAGFVHHDEPSRNMVAGSELSVELPGPWNGPCTVEDVSDDSVLMATLDGHMEAGHIRFSTIDSDSGSGYSFQIRSWARAGDRAFAALHVTVPIGREVQTAMWCAMCDRAVTISGGRRSGPIRVTTEELADSDISSDERSD